MPIFAQTGIDTRLLGTGLSRVRIRGDDRESRAAARAVPRESRLEAAKEDTRPQAPSRDTSLSALLSRNQRAELILQRVRESRSEDETAGGPEGPVVRQRTLPGVGATRTEADTSVQRPGRLSPETANPVLNRARSAVGRVNVRQPTPADSPAFPTVAAAETPPLDRGRDAQIRLLAAGAREQAEVAERPTAEGATPTAEQISRANTTGEIRENLQAGIHAVGAELQSVAARQQQATTQRISRETAQATQERQGETVQDNRSEIRELQTDRRQLARDLSATEREIRSRQNQNARLQSGAQGSPAASAIAMGSQLNILSA